MSVNPTNKITRAYAISPTSVKIEGVLNGCKFHARVASDPETAQVVHFRFFTRRGIFAINMTSETDIEAGTAISTRAGKLSRPAHAGEIAKMCMRVSNICLLLRECEQADEWDDKFDILVPFLEVLVPE